MSIFRYYITDLLDGAIKGTNSSDVAIEFSICEDYYVVDTMTGKWLTLGEEVDIVSIQ